MNVQFIGGSEMASARLSLEYGHFRDIAKLGIEIVCNPL